MAFFWQQFLVEKHWSDNLSNCRQNLNFPFVIIFLLPYLTCLALFSIIRELRIACTVAQMEREGGISPRMSPLAQVWLLYLWLLLKDICLYSLYIFVIPLHGKFTTSVGCADFYNSQNESYMHTTILSCPVMCQFVNCGFLLHFSRSVTQGTFWQGQVSPFQELMLISIPLNTIMVCEKIKPKILIVMCTVQLHFSLQYCMMVE